MNKTTYLFVTTLMFIISVSCGSKKSTDPPSVTDTTKTSNTTKVEDFNKWFEGEIGKKYMICMDLKNTSGKLTGVLNYAGQNKSLTVEGSIDSSGNLTINEFNDKGKNTGVFKGRLKDEHITGKWSKADGSNSMDFDIYVSEGEETFCAGVHSAPPEDWSGSYQQEYGQTLQLNGPDKEGAINFTLKMPDKDCRNGKTATANLVNSSNAEYYEDDSDCVIRFTNNDDGTISVKTDGCGDPTCADWVGTYNKR